MCLCFLYIILFCEIFARFTGASLSRIFLAVDQYLPYNCNKKTGVCILRLGRENFSPLTSSSQINREIKSSRIKVVLQYMMVMLSFNTCMMTLLSQGLLIIQWNYHICLGQRIHTDCSSMPPNDASNWKISPSICRCWWNSNVSYLFNIFGILWTRFY